MGYSGDPDREGTQGRNLVGWELTSLYLVYWTADFDADAGEGAELGIVLMWNRTRKRREDGWIHGNTNLTKIANIQYT